MKPVKPLAPAPVDAPARFELVDVAAIKALEAGTATPDQQRRAWEWILVGAADMGGNGFRGEAPFGLAFHAGRRFVGTQILGLLKLDINKLKDDNNG